MSDQTCATGCGRPTRDVLLLCSTCSRKLEHQIGDIPGELAQLNVTLRRKAVTGAANSGASIGGSAESRMPIHAGAYEARLELETRLVGWVRDLAERHGEEQHLPGPSMQEMSLWLLARMYRIETHPAAGDIYEEITTSMDRVRRLIAGPEERVLVGICDSEGMCTEWLYAEPKAERVTCRQCGTVHRVEDSREHLETQMRGRLMTMREIAGFATHHGINRRRAMKLMGTWVGRGQIVASSKTAEGEDLYPFGTTLDLLRNTPVRARKAG